MEQLVDNQEPQRQVVLHPQCSQQRLIGVHPHLQVPQDPIVALVYHSVLVETQCLLSEVELLNRNQASVVLHQHNSLPLEAHQCLLLPSQVSVEDQQ